MKLNGTHQLLVYSDNEVLLGYNTDTIKKKTQTLIGANEEFGLEVNIEKTKYIYMLMSLHQNAENSHDIQRANRSFEIGADLLHVNYTTHLLLQQEYK
jgi:hypothetical protein